MEDRIEIEHQGQTFYWSEEAGIVAASGDPIPNATRRSLQTKLDRLLASRDKVTRNPILLLSRASAARQRGQIQQAERLARRVLEQDDRDEAAVAFLSSLLRQRHKPAAAVRLTDPFAETENVIILTTRAAALLDVGDLAAAQRVVERAEAIAGERGRLDEELRAVSERLARERRGSEESGP